MATRPASQLWIASNAGGRSSEMLRHYRDLGRAGDSPSLAWFEWAAADADDPDDPATWANAIPTLYERQGVTLEAVTDFHGTMTAELFDREILNRWPLETGDYVLDLSVFMQLVEPLPRLFVNLHSIANRRPLLSRGSRSPAWSRLAARPSPRARRPMGRNNSYRLRRSRRISFAAFAAPKHSRGWRT